MASQQTSQLARSQLAGGVASVGQKVLAAGSPSGTYVQVSAGIVSAVVQDGVVTRVQTDAAVNPGNSGGPLLDEDGNVLGIVVTKSTTEEGVAWAVAADEAQQFLAGNRATGDSTADPGPDTAPDATSTPPSGSTDPTTARASSSVGALAAASLLGAAALIGVAARRRSRAPLLDLSDLADRPTPVTPSGATRRKGVPRMSNLTLTITDATSSKAQRAAVPADAPVVRVLARVISAMNLPQAGPDGLPLSYKFHHRESGRQLREDDTLAAAGVGEGDTLRIVAEITAG